MSIPFERKCHHVVKTVISALISQNETPTTQQTNDELVPLVKLIPRHAIIVGVKVGKERDTKGHPY